MTDVELNHPLLARIQTLRQRTRLVLTLYGIGMLLTAATAAALVLPLLDYVIHFSPGVRVILGIAVVAGLAAVAWRCLLAPLSTRLTDQFLASRVERLNQPLADELISALHFLHTGLPRQNAMAARAIETVQAETKSLHFEQALDTRSAMRPLGGAILLVALLAVIGLASPTLASIAFSRWVDPFGLHEWPRTTHVHFEWPGGKAPVVHPLGDPLTVRAVVTAGYRGSLHVLLYTWSDTQGEQREVMTFQEGQSDNSHGRYVYEKRLEPVGEASFSLRLVAGDDHEQLPVEIRLSPRPEVAGLKAEILPPSYVKNAPADGKAYDLLSEVARAVEGSTVRLTVRSTKPFATVDGIPQISLLESGKDAMLPLEAAERKLVDPSTAQLSFRAARSIEFRIQVRDTDGFDNRVAGTLRIDVVPDSLPTVVLAEPRRPMEVVPEAVLDVQVQATDDLGLGDVLLQADNFDAKPGDAPRVREPLRWSRQSAETATLAVSGAAGMQWNLAPLGLKPGDRLSIYGAVRDNYELPLMQFPGGLAAVKDPFEKDPGDLVRHRFVRSAPLSLMIQTKERIEESARKDLQELRDQIKRLNEQQTLTYQQTLAIQKAARDAGATTAQQRQQLAELATQQANQAQRAMAIESRAEQIRQAMKTNRMADSELGKMANDVATGMEDVGQNNMPKAAAELSNAQESAGRPADAGNDAQRKEQERKAAEETASAAGKAGQQQELAMSTMNKLIDRLGAAGDFEAHLSKVNEILERQKELEQKLREQAVKTLGRPLNQLTAQERANLEKIAQEQEKLAGETAKVTEGMEKTADQLTRTDPASSESLRRAAQVSRQQQVSGKQNSASQNAGNNQMSNAASDMTQARRGLEEMKEELQQQNRRQLEQLALQLQQLLDSLLDIRKKQLAVNDETVKAGEKALRDLLEPLGNRQSRLQGNALAEAQRAEAIRDGRPIALDLQDAATAMGEATAALLKTIQTAAVQPEKDALAALDKAIEKLQKQKQAVDEQLKQEDLASLRRQYEDIKKSQEQIKTASDDLIKRLAGKEPERADLAALSAQAAAQAKLIDALQKLSQHKELSKYEVLVWINQQIIENMTDSRQRLEKAQLGGPLSTAQAAAIDRLQEIIDALKEEQAKKSEFASGGGGGGGGGGSGRPPLLPPAAQLKLLKSQQIRINTATVDTDKQLAQSKSDAEKGQLRQDVEKLGEKQEKIKNLAQKVIDNMKR